MTDKTDKAKTQRSKRERKHRVRDEPCRHPINRRIGDQCALCGDTVARRRKAAT